jgi:hypothetical protein
MKDYPRDGLMHCTTTGTGAVVDGDGRTTMLAHLQRSAASRRQAAGQYRDRLPFLLRAEMAGDRASPSWQGAGRIFDPVVQPPGLSFVDMHRAGLCDGRRRRSSPFIDNRGAITTWCLDGAQLRNHARGDCRRRSPDRAHSRRMAAGRQPRQRDLLEYVVASAKLRAGRPDDARSFIEARRPATPGGSFPLAGLTTAVPSERLSSRATLSSRANLCHPERTPCHPERSEGMLRP